MTNRPPTGQRHSLRRDLLWTALLWCGGVGAAALLTLPFHLIVSAIQHP